MAVKLQHKSAEVSKEMSEIQLRSSVKNLLVKGKTLNHLNRITILKQFVAGQQSSYVSQFTNRRQVAAALFYPERKRFTRLLQKGKSIKKLRQRRREFKTN